MSNSHSNLAIQKAIQAAEQALAHLKAIAPHATEVKFGQATLLVHPANEGDRVDVCFGPKGHTTVNYTPEGVIVDIYGGESTGFELVKAIAIPNDDLDWPVDDAKIDAAKTVTVVVEASALKGGQRPPKAAGFKVNAVFFKLMADRHLKIKSYGEHAQVTFECEPIRWIPEKVQKDDHFWNPEIVCGKSGFWYTDRRQKDGCEVECEWLNTADLLAIFKQATHGEIVVVGSHDFKDYATGCLTGAGGVLEAHEVAHND